MASDKEKEGLSEEPSVEDQRDLDSTRLLLGSTLDDETILNVIVEAGRESKGSLQSVMGLIAERIMELKIPNGRGLVIPLMALIHRNLRQLPTPVGFDETLAAMRGRLSSASFASERMEAGLKLGDRATHVAAGWKVTGQGPDRVMSSGEHQRYATQMARLGYGSALEAAERDRGPRARVVQESVLAPFHRHPEVVQVLRTLVPVKSRFEKLLKDGWGLVTMGES